MNRPLSDWERFTSASTSVPKPRSDACVGLSSSGKGSCLSGKPNEPRPERNRSWRFFCFVVLGWLSCTERLTPINAVWEATVADLSKKVLALNGRLQALQKQFDGLPMGGDAGSAAAADQRKWLESFRQAADDIERMEQAITLAEARVRKSFEEQSASETEAIIAEETRNLTAERQRATGALDALDAAFLAVRASIIESAQPGPEMTAEDQALGWVHHFRRTAREGGALQVHELAFLNGKADLDAKSPQNQEGLQALAAVFKECKKLKVKITGHTSREGDAKTNERLSLARAEAVRKALIAKGVRKDMLRVAGAGGREPLVAEPTKPAEAKALGPTVLNERRQMNRRMTFEVVSRCQ